MKTLLKDFPSPFIPMLDLNRCLINGKRVDRITVVNVYANVHYRIIYSGEIGEHRYYPNDNMDSLYIEDYGGVEETTSFFVAERRKELLDA